MIGISMRMEWIKYPSGNAELRDCLASDWWPFLSRVLPGDGIVPLPNSPRIIKGLLSGIPFEGFIFSGGDDWGKFPRRDETEKYLFAYAESRNLPVIGICRGAQVINLLCGGRNSPGFSKGHAGCRHDIQPACGTVYKLPGCLNVNSFHNCGIPADCLAPGLLPLAFAGDESVEAFASADGRICGVMWHPEREANPAAHDAHIFKQCLKGQKMKTAAIILAAGRGSRMGELTSSHPKCLTPLAGKTLLDWQREALEKAGIERLLVVRGYLAQCVQGAFDTVDNPRWAETNMVSSLLCADKFIRAFFAGGGDRVIVSYSDIVYHPDHVAKLLNTSQDIAITYDTRWKSLWELRFEDVLSDAETFSQKDGILLQIGEKPQNIDEIQGQYMGLLSFNAAGWQTITELCASLGEKTDKTDMTAFLRLLLKNNVPVGAVPIEGKWCETDNATDLQRYENALQSGNWSHDWRELR